TIKNLVKSGMGVTYLPRFAVEEELERGELAEIPTEVAHSRITAECAHHKNKWVSPAMELFIRLMTGAEKTSQ
ncbi:MAG TPA: substrate-binding domain-containing protein, partial [Candidatus Lachnoclostridium stercorigallinarum]|nr:substrate-binding domain-containing protein [Candidatus Lachnoclostridium stercorigallinarum]